MLIVLKHNHEQAAMSANYILGYRMLISGASLVICTQLETLGLDVNTAWSITYIIMATFICIASITVLVIQEPPQVIYLQTIDILLLAIQNP